MENTIKSREDWCMKAVEEDSDNFKRLKSKYKTEKVCMLAVTIDPSLLRCVKIQTEQMCLYALRRNPALIMYVDAKTEEMYRIYAKHTGRSLITIIQEFDVNMTRPVKFKIGMCCVCFDTNVQTFRFGYCKGCHEGVCKECMDKLDQCPVKCL